VRHDGDETMPTGRATTVTATAAAKNAQGQAVFVLRVIRSSYGP
jgi:hypothetical protein